MKNEHFFATKMLKSVRCLNKFVQKCGKMGKYVSFFVLRLNRLV